MKVSDLHMHSGTKRKVRASEKRRRRFIIATIVIAVAIVLIFGLFSNNALFPSQTLKAAIVDQLSIKYANSAFLQTSTTILERAGFAVDYYESREVTVEFYRNLPTHGYDLILLRVHAATHSSNVSYTVLFTSELRDIEKYNYEKVTDRILMGTLTIPRGRSCLLYDIF